METEIGGIINAEEEDEGVKNEGFTRFVAETVVLLVGSRVSRRGARGVDTVGRGGLGWGVGNGNGVTLVVLEGSETVAEGWCGCSGIAVFGAIPTFIAACKTKNRLVN